jgi:ribosome-associated protein
MIRIAPGIEIDENLIEEQFVRAPGPGGQNVNKVASAVQLRFDAAHAELPPEVLRRLVGLAGSQFSREGIIVIQASRFRSQVRNREDARERLLALLQKAAIRPKPRVKTRPTAGSRERRLETKRLRARTKRQRTPGSRGEN